jgi:hypothetical protein
VLLPAAQPIWSLPMEFGQVARLAAGPQGSASTLEQQVARIVPMISTTAVSWG